MEEFYVKKPVTKDTLILVYYVNMSKIHQEDVGQYMQSISIRMKLPDSYDVLQYYVAITEGDSRIECINPKVVSEEEYQNIGEILEEIEKQRQEFLENNEINYEK